MKIEFFKGDAVDQHVEWIEKQLGTSNDRLAPNEGFQPFVFLLQINEEKAGGIVAFKSWDWLVIDSIVVMEPYRNTAYGKLLLEKAEAYGRSIGCKRAKLETFQAEAFYRKFGYETHAVLHDYPPGFSFATMVKLFD